MITAYQEAARSDPRAARVWKEALTGREWAVRELVMSLGSALRPPLTVDRGLDLYIALTLPENYRTLTERGWTSGSGRRAATIPHQRAVVVVGPTLHRAFAR